MTHQIWSERHRPKKFTDLVFEDNIHIEIVRWLSMWKPGDYSILLTGPTGVGKTSLVHIMANMLGYNVVEYNASIERNHKIIKEIMSSSGQISLHNKKNLVLIDEIDGISSDVNFINQLVKESSRLTFPIIFTSNGFYNFSSKNIKIFNIKKPSLNNVRFGLKPILEKENIKIDNLKLDNLIKESNYDFRSIINTLQLKLPPNKNYVMIPNSFSVAIKVFKSNLKVTTPTNISYFDYLSILYSPMVHKLCFESYLKNISLANVNEISDANFYHEYLPAEYEFLCMDKYNKHCRRNDFENLELLKPLSIDKRIQTRFSPYVYYTEIRPFLKQITKIKIHEETVNYLKDVIKYYGKELFDDEWIVKVQGFRSIKSKKFKFTYKEGSSSAVKRDLKIIELLNRFK
ncbi:Replication factor C large subunit [Astathelohania contejeani]|uniref:Replication factor C large subunit n=1 Tax=Astathelohania contejeani TaxID=164912 RepID=A0ABQ7I054_9MICR|nr:Replication factor C large subunit [Thelohania contejeani]